VNTLRQVIDLVFEFLNVSVSLVVFGRLRVVVPVELLDVLIIGQLDLVIDILDYEVHVLTLAHLRQDVSLEFQHRLLDDVVVEVDHVL